MGRPELLSIILIALCLYYLSTNLNLGSFNLFILGVTALSLTIAASIATYIFLKSHEKDEDEEE